MTEGLQPFLHDAVIALRAPTQAWSRRSGDMRAPIDGVYHGDRRFLSAVSVDVTGETPEPIAHGVRDAQHVVFDAVLRDLDDPTPDPHVRLTREREVADGRVTETIAVSSAARDGVDAEVRVRLVPDFRPLGDVKAGLGTSRPWTARADADGVHVTSGAASLAVSAPGAAWERDDDAIVLTWPIAVAAGDAASVGWSATMDDPALVVRGVPERAAWTVDTDGVDRRLARWIAVSLDDLDALRLALPPHPEDAFLGAGAPWFLTLFGRDALWAARMMLPVDAGLAASTLRVLARLQGTTDDPRTEEEPGKIPHELRADELSLPGEGIVLPPLYYGTVDATALWACLLVEA
ncbi:MAG: glycogen debranching N-terminal domain-containing protein, partial [Microbacterium sp.]